MITSTSVTQFVQKFSVNDVDIMVFVPFFFPLATAKGRVNKTLGPSKVHAGVPTTGLSKIGLFYFLFLFEINVELIASKNFLI